MSSKNLSWLLLVTAVAVTASTARADDVASADVPLDRADSTHTIDRSWLYVDDAKTPGVGAVTGMTSVAYANAGANPDPTSAPYRAFAFNTAQPGALVSLGAEVGLLPWLSAEAIGQTQLAGVAGSASPGAVAGLRVRLSPSTWEHLHLLASAGYLRETWSGSVVDRETGHVTPTQAKGDDGAWAEAAASGDVGRVRLGLTAHGEHVFVGGRDGVDVMLKAGVAFRVVEVLRLGVEWVGQDLEESFASGAEGGSRQFAGPVASVQLLHDRLTVVGGPSLGLSTGSPKVLGRLAVAYSF